MNTPHLQTPGVYIVERDAFPNSFVTAETAVPVFIGYTDTAIDPLSGRSLIGKPICVNSLTEYVAYFGRQFNAKFIIADAGAGQGGASFTLNGIQKAISLKPNHTFYLYNAIRMFYANGGGKCYIVSAGTYGDKPEGLQMKAADFTSPLAALLNEAEPAIVLAPDAIALGDECYRSVYTQFLAHCRQTGSRFAIFDLIKQTTADQRNAMVTGFRAEIGNDALTYGAAYYPWLQTDIVQPAELSFANLDDGINLAHLLPENEAKAIIARYQATSNPNATDNSNLHVFLQSVSPAYMAILDAMRSQLNTLPPSGAIAGVYTMTDTTRGVWQAPANVALNAVKAPAFEVCDGIQQELAMDLSGKSINAIRSFPGIGTMVWGARTLDGNSQDWRYISVRRTGIMIEQSVKQAVSQYVFAPNEASTWVAVKSMITGFLTNLWKQGGLTGATPNDAFEVNVGLGYTMTADDVQQGNMRTNVQAALVMPAEFIEFEFEQQMQKGS